MQNMAKSRPFDISGATALLHWRIDFLSYAFAIKVAKTLFIDFQHICLFVYTKKISKILSAN